jgi:hypothetical protein
MMALGAILGRGSDRECCGRRDVMMAECTHKNSK